MSQSMELTAGMTEDERMFFTETKLPARLAAAAYSSSANFKKVIIPILDSSATSTAMEISAYPLDLNLMELNRASNDLPAEGLANPPAEGLANWMLNSRVHMAIIPVLEPEDGTLSWDLALVFRGTQPYSVTNWVTDFSFDQEPVAKYILHEPEEKNILQKPKKKDEMLVHSGFHQAFQGLIPKAEPGHDDPTIKCIESAIQQYINDHRRIKKSSAQQTQDGEDGFHPQDGFQAEMDTRRKFRDKLTGILADEKRPPRRILSIGHSLGGALATLGGAWCKTTLCNEDRFRNRPVQCITFGSPRVGNKKFAQVWDALLRSTEGIENTEGKGKSYRVVNALDVVPSVPLPFNFQHVGKLVYLHREVQNWDVKVWPCLHQERPLPNTGSPIDHVPWHYTSAMVLAEATAASATKQERKSLLPPAQQSWWFLSFAQQLKPSFMWEVFKRTVVLDLPLHAHYGVLGLSWVTAVSSFVAGQAVCWLALFPLITLLLPAFTAALLVDTFVAGLLLPFKVLFGARAGNLIQSSPKYKFGNITLALLSLVVMVCAYVSAWLGL